MTFYLILKLCRHDVYGDLLSNWSTFSKVFLQNQCVFHKHACSACWFSQLWVADFQSWGFGIIIDLIHLDSLEDRWWNWIILVAIGIEEPKEGQHDSPTVDECDLMITSCCASDNDLDCLKVMMTFSMMLMIKMMLLISAKLWRRC